MDTRFVITDGLYVNSFMKADKDKFHLYNPKLQPFASALRKEMTKAEACLWKYVLKPGNCEVSHSEDKDPSLIKLLIL